MTFGFPLALVGLTTVTALSGIVAAIYLTVRLNSRR